jgi:hypothetical protein
VHAARAGSRRLALISGALGALLLVAIPLMEIANTVLSAESLDSTKSLALPRWLDDLIEHSAAAYPAHAALGTILESLSLSPAATAVQWLKAGAHASSDADLERAAGGIAAAYRRDVPDGRVLQTICKLKEIGNRDQVRIVDRSGVPCDRWTPAVALQSSADPQETTAGTSVRITARITSATAFAGLVDIEVHDADDQTVAQWVFYDQSLVAGQQHVYVASWELPPDLPAGDYEVKVGVFEPGWAALHGWNNAGALITVPSSP